MASTLSPAAIATATSYVAGLYHQHGADRYLDLIRETQAEMLDEMDQDEVEAFHAGSTDYRFQLTAVRIYETSVH